MKHGRRLSIRESQKISLSILKKTDRICRSLGLEYWIMYGTLIGAVRHGGFIPWDDDLDIAMPRPDFCKLLDYFKKHGNQVLSLHIDSIETVKNYPFYIPRICEDECRLVFDHYEYTSGVFVDIYPIDGMGCETDAVFWKKSQKKIRHLQKGLMLSTSKDLLAGSHLVSKIGNIPFHMTAKRLGNKYYFNRLDEISCKFSWEYSKNAGLAVWDTGLHLFPKEVFQSTQRMLFEDYLAPVPAGYQMILESHYGDYMRVPPENERRPSHGYQAYRMDKKPK